MWSGSHPWDVGDDFERDATAGDGAALRHPLQQALGETLPTHTRSNGYEKEHGEHAVVMSPRSCPATPQAVHPPVSQ